MFLRFYITKMTYFYFIFSLLILLVLSEQLNLFSSGITPYIVLKNKKHFYQYDNRQLQSMNPVNDFSSGNKKEKQSKNIIKSDLGQSGPWSNAFNFKKIWGTQVDPRTGTLSAHVKADSLLSNLGHGPNIDLEVNYSSNAHANPDKLGQGWS